MLGLVQFLCVRLTKPAALTSWGKREVFNRNFINIYDTFPHSVFIPVPYHHISEIMLITVRQWRTTLLSRSISWNRCYHRFFFKKKIHGSGRTLQTKLPLRHWRYIALLEQFAGESDSWSWNSATRYKNGRASQRKMKQAELLITYLYSALPSIHRPHPLSL